MTKIDIVACTDKWFVMPTGVIQDGNLEFYVYEKALFVDRLFVYH